MLQRPVWGLMQIVQTSDEIWYNTLYIAVYITVYWPFPSTISLSLSLPRSVLRQTLIPKPNRKTFGLKTLLITHSKLHFYSCADNLSTKTIHCNINRGNKTLLGSSLKAIDLLGSSTILHSKETWIIYGHQVKRTACWTPCLRRSPWELFIGCVSFYRGSWFIYKQNKGRFSTIFINH